MKIIGHRGAKGLAPENTLKSFEKALEHGVDIIETDVHITENNIAVLAHDPNLHTPDGRSRKIADYTYDELLQHCPDLVRLEDAIDFIDRRVPLYLEVKEKQPTADIITIIEDYLARGWQPTDFLFASFDFKVLKALHSALPAVPIVVGERWSGARATRRAKKLNTNLLSMQSRWLWKGFIVPMQRRGWQIYAFTMNKPRKARRFGRYGLAGIFTDYPDQFTKA